MENRSAQRSWSRSDWRALSAILGVLCLTAASLSAADLMFRTTDGVTLHYADVNPPNAVPRPAIVFIPGWTMAGDIFRPQIEGLVPLGRFRVITIDPRSQGDSEKTADGNQLERRAMQTRSA